MLESGCVDDLEGWVVPMPPAPLCCSIYSHLASCVVCAVRCTQHHQTMCTVSSTCLITETQYDGAARHGTLNRFRQTCAHLDDADASSWPSSLASVSRRCSRGPSGAWSSARILWLWLERGETPLTAPLRPGPVLSKPPTALQIALSRASLQMYRTASTVRNQSLIGVSI